MTQQDGEHPNPESGENISTASTGGPAQASTARKVGLSLLALLIAICLALSIIALAGAIVILRTQ